MARRAVANGREPAAQGGALRAPATGHAGQRRARGDTVALFPGREVVVERRAVRALATAGADLGTSADERAALAGEAIPLYGGDLLPLDPYEDWAFHPRQRLAAAPPRAAAPVGRFDELVALDPTDEAPTSG